MVARANAVIKAWESECVDLRSRFSRTRACVHPLLAAAHAVVGRLSRPEAPYAHIRGAVVTRGDAWGVHASVHAGRRRRVPTDERDGWARWGVRWQLMF